MTARIDTISPIHKAVRKILFDQALLLARTDFESQPAAQAALDATRRALGMLHAHGEKEDAFVFPKIASHDPKLAAEAAVQHSTLEASMREVEHLAATVAMVTGAERAQAGKRLRVRFEQLVAEELAHMAFEESKILAALWAVLDDRGLVALHHEITASIPPEQALAWRELMLASVDARERAMLAA